MSGAYRVLIAAHDRQLDMMLQRSLCSDARFDWIGSVQDGLCALKMTREWLPDLIVMDAFLPMLDAAAYIRLLAEKTIEKYPFIVVLSPVSGKAAEQIAPYADLVWPKAEDLRGLGAAALAQMDDQLLSALSRVRMQARKACADVMLSGLGMNASLKGYEYLCCAAAAVSLNVELSRHLSTRLYPWIARSCGTKAVLVERAIRHAIESMVNRSSPQMLFEAFGNTMDPQRGKPTNSEMIAGLGERIRIQSHTGGQNRV